jgi:hypothetical protein
MSNDKTARRKKGWLIPLGILILVGCGCLFLWTFLSFALGSWCEGVGTECLWWPYSWYAPLYE